MRDTVRYALGFGAAGELAHRLLVRRDLEAIFDFRQARACPRCWPPPAGVRVRPAMAGGPLQGRVALVAGATRGAGARDRRRPRRGGRDGLRHGPQLARRALRVRPPGDDRGDGRSWSTRRGGRGHAVVADHLDPEQVAALVARDRRGAGPPRRARQRHLGRRAAVRVGHAAVGARPRQRPAAAAPGRGDAPDHQPPRAAAHAARARRPRRRDDRWDRGLQRDQAADQRLSTTSPNPRCCVSRWGAGPGARAARRDRRRAHAGLAALGDDARGLRGARGELARRDGSGSPHFCISESPLYVGRAVAALAADPEVARHNGASLSSGGLAREYGFTDTDGTRPDAWRYMVEVQDDRRTAGRRRLPLTRPLRRRARRARRR